MVLVLKYCEKLILKAICKVKFFKNSKWIHPFMSLKDLALMGLQQPIGHMSLYNCICFYHTFGYFLIMLTFSI